MSDITSDYRIAGGLPYRESERRRAVTAAERWTAKQAARLGTNSDFILEAIRLRAWLPEQIERVTSRYELEGLPPRLRGVESWIDAKIRRRAA